MKIFWDWYNKNYKINLTIAAGLFSLQLVHLLWLLTHIVSPKLGLPDLFVHLDFLTWPLILVDYTEIPAIITTSILYVNEIRKKNNSKSWFLLSLLNIQWIHILWITDEFLIQNSYFTGIAWWSAVAIDYFELPVIIDTVKKLSTTFTKNDLKKALEVLNTK